MKLITKRKIEQDVEVDLKPPMFWKSCTFDEYLAFLDEKTVIKLLLINDEYISLIHTVPERMKDELLVAHHGWDLCDESEFMRVYDDAWESIRMRPVEHNNGFDKEVNDNLKQSINY